MGYQPLEKLLVRSNFSVYKLVRMASRRAMELADGSLNLIETIAGSKTATIALDEIASGKVVLKEAAANNPPPPKNSPAQEDNTENSQKVEQEQNA